MSQFRLPVILPLAVALLAAGGYTYYQAQMQQAATLARITALESRLEARNKHAAQYNAALLHSMKWYVCRNHNQASDHHVLANTQQIHARIQALVDTLHQVRQQLQAGRQPVAALRRLPALLNDNQLQRIAPDTPLPIQPFLPVSTAGWLGIWLDAEPVPAALASLTYLENQVQRYGHKALADQAQKVGESGDYFYITQLVALPTSEVVPAGGLYEARLFLADWNQLPLNWHPYCVEQFLANGADLTRSRRSHWGGQVTIAVPARQPGQPDTLRRQWQGRIRATGYYHDTVVQVTVPYLVAQPYNR